jgi:hypothetical protein
MGRCGLAERLQSLCVHLREPLERLQWSRELVFLNARSDEGALGDSLSSVPRKAIRTLFTAVSQQSHVVGIEPYGLTSVLVVKRFVNE